MFVEVDRRAADARGWARMGAWVCVGRGTDVPSTAAGGFN